VEQKKGMSLVELAPVREDAETPELREWERIEGGGLKGRVYGRDGCRPGHKLTTSKMVALSPKLDESEEVLGLRADAAGARLGQRVDPAGSRPGQHADAAGARLRHFYTLTAESMATVCEGALVVTRSHTVYRLGAPQITAAPPAPAPDSGAVTAAEEAAAPALAAPAQTASPAAAAEAPACDATQPFAQFGVVSELDGYRLKPSTGTRTGYAHVDQEKNGTFRVHFNGLGDTFSVSSFATAVEAALWCSKFSTGEDPPMPNGKTRGLPRRGPPSVLVSEMEGYTLKCSARNGKTGYMNVESLSRSGTFRVKIQLESGGRRLLFYVNGFATAVAAALWNAKYDAGVDPTTPAGEKFRPTDHPAPPRLKAAGPAAGPASAAAAAAAALQDGGGAHSAGGVAAAAPPPVVACADGVQLHLWPYSATGYKCVHRSGQRFVIDCTLFLENKRDAGGRRKRQTFASAQEAAVEYARVVAAAHAQQQTGSDADEGMSDVRYGAEVKAAVG